VEWVGGAGQDAEGEGEDLWGGLRREGREVCKRGDEEQQGEAEKEGMREGRCTEAQRENGRRGSLVSMQACGGDERKGARKEGLEVGLHHLEGAHTHTHTHTHLTATFLVRRLSCIPARTADLDAQDAIEQGVGAVKGSIAAPAAPAAAALPPTAVEHRGGEGGGRRGHVSLRFDGPCWCWCWWRCWWL